MTLLTPDFLDTKTYPFAALRQALSDQGGGVQEGVIGVNDLKVTQRAAGATMQVDVAAGAGWVQGDTNARQGKYHVINDATITTAALAANASGNPRVDSIILHVYDSTVSGASDTPLIEILTGTPTAGAQIATPTAALYRAGAAALPATAMLLADVIVASGAASVVNANINDRRQWALGAHYSMGGTNAGNYTVVSGTPALPDATNLTCNIECSGAPIRVDASLSANTATVGSTNHAYVIIDGTSWMASVTWQQPVASQWVPVHIHSERIGLAAGRHSFGLYVDTSAAAGIIVANTGGFLPRFTVREELRQQAAN